MGPVWEGCRESRRCSRDTYPESYTTKYTSIRRLHRWGAAIDRGADVLSRRARNLFSIAALSRSLSRLSLSPLSRLSLSPLSFSLSLSLSLSVVGLERGGGSEFRAKTLYCPATAPISNTFGVCTLLTCAHFWRVYTFGVCPGRESTSLVDGVVT